MVVWANYCAPPPTKCDLLTNTTPNFDVRITITQPKICFERVVFLWRWLFIVCTFPLMTRNRKRCWKLRAVVLEDILSVIIGLNCTGIIIVDVHRLGNPRRFHPPLQMTQDFFFILLTAAFDSCVYVKRFTYFCPLLGLTLILFFHCALKQARTSAVSKIFFMNPNIV